MKFFALKFSNPWLTGRQKFFGFFEDIDESTDSSFGGERFSIPQLPKSKLDKRREDLEALLYGYDIQRKTTSVHEHQASKRWIFSDERQLVLQGGSGNTYELQSFEIQYASVSMVFSNNVMHQLVELKRHVSQIMICFANSDK